MAQAPVRQINISDAVKIELERRKQILSRRYGKKVNMDFVIRDLLGWL